MHQPATFTRRRALGALALLSLSLLSACNMGPSPTSAGAYGNAVMLESRSKTGTGTGTAYSAGYGASTGTAEPLSPRPMPTAAPSSAPGMSAPATDAASGAPALTAPPANQARSGLLTAGTWRDLDHWDYWLGLMGKQEWRKMTEYWEVSPLQRLSIDVSYEGRPAIDQALLLKNGAGYTIARARSDNQGRAEFFTSLFSSQSGPFTVETADGTIVLEGLQPQAFRSSSTNDNDDQDSANNNQTQAPPSIHSLKLGTAPGNPEAVDLMLMVDTTGSMGDELEYLKVELRNVLNRVQESNGQLQLRASTNFYRDHQDEYLVRPFPFTSNFETLQSQLRAQSADGGGDTPEAVTDALDNALNQHEWSGKARARLLFLVLDAPPHHDSQQLNQLRELIPRAQALGVKVIPVASSGVDKETEFLLRMLAITSGGEYVFLTDDSGVGGSHIEPTIGAHDVEKLNDLMVRLVQKYTR